jgi:hypothetical protein
MVVKKKEKQRFCELGVPVMNYIKQNGLRQQITMYSEKKDGVGGYMTWSEALLNRPGGVRAKNRMAEHFRRPTADNRNPHIRMPRYQGRFPENRRSLRGFGLRRRWPKSRL